MQTTIDFLIESESLPIPGTSKTIADAKSLIAKIADDIERSTLPDGFRSERVIDWGNSRGQGKRSGGVKGGMSNAPVGKTTYHGISWSKYKDDFDGNMDWLVQSAKFNSSTILRYVLAREYGCNQMEARVFAESLYQPRQRS